MTPRPQIGIPQLVGWGTPKRFERTRTSIMMSESRSESPSTTGMPRHVVNRLGARRLSHKRHVGCPRRTCSAGCGVRCPRCKQGRHAAVCTQWQSLAGCHWQPSMITTGATGTWQHRRRRRKAAAWGRRQVWALPGGESAVGAQRGRPCQRRGAGLREEGSATGSLVCTLAVT
jgi:hypothetical protein